MIIIRLNVYEFHRALCATSVGAEIIVVNPILVR